MQRAIQALATLMWTTAFCTAARAATLHVDGASRETAGDGSEAKPVTHIHAAIAAAQSGDTSKIARGTYAESLEIENCTFDAGDPANKGTP